MKRVYIYIFLILSGVSFFAGCNKMEDDFDYNDVVSERVVSPYCMIEENGTTKYSSGILGTKSLVNQTTNTGDLLCNFLRLDQRNDSLFSSTNNYTTNWSEAYISEGTISSAHSHNGGYMRTVSLHPVQPYNNGVQRIRMIGWYPRTCDLPRDAQGNTPSTLFNGNNFSSTYTDVEIDGKDYIGVKFTGLDGSKDIMVSDVQDASFTYPFNSTNKYFKFKHYLSAIKIYATADESSQDVSMWGEIEKVVVMGQPTSCTVVLPEERGRYAEKIVWGDENAKLDIITTPVFGANDNSIDNDVAEKYPISLGGSSADHYLGYMLVQPNEDLRIQIHTTSGIHDVNIEAVKDQTPLFNAGYIYEIHLNFKTDGTIFTYLGNEGGEKYYDLTAGALYTDDEGESSTFNYKYANCYIIKSNPEGTPADPMYDGFCFDGTVAGNGENGLMSIGAQKLYPQNVHLKPKSADVVWETAPRLVTQIELIMGYVRFKVAKNPNDPKKFMEGNAVIAVYDENRNVLWSWHIWITDMPQEVSYTEGETTITLLDRNLGATAATWEGSGTSWGNTLETYGLYYQWGRKDPSMGPPQWNYSPINMITAPYYDYSSDTYNAAEVVRVAQPVLKDAVENPMYLIMPTSHTQTYYYNWMYEKIDFLWGYNSSTGKTTKTIYDPCPYGYRVSGGELTDLFNYAAKSGSFTLSEYGQKVSVPTDATNQSVKSEFYFPYTGYKGVDRGLNSLVCSWRYVGEKADYQSAVVSTYADDPEYFMHRTRIYLSKNRTWSETGVGDYTGHQISDHTNRKTAAPVRCVRNVEINRVMAFITPEKGNVPNTTDSKIKFTLYAESFGAPITEASLVLGYHLKDNPEVHHEIKFKQWSGNGITDNSTNGEGFIWNLVYEFDFAEFISSHGVDLSNNTGELRFILNVKNQSNVQKMSSTTILVQANDYISFEEWEANNTVFTGQQINRVLRLYGDSRPVKVEMIVDGDGGTDGVNDGTVKDISANLVDINSGEDDAPYTNNWYCTTNGSLSFNTAGTHTVKFRVTYDTNPVKVKESETKEFIVQNIKKITSVGEISADKQYVIKNVATGRYIYDGGTDIKAKTNIDNTTTFRLPLYYDQDGVFQIRNVDSQQYVQSSTNGNNGTLKITTTYQGYASPFNINLNDSTNGYFVITRNNFYWKYDANSSSVEYVRVNNNNQITDTHRWEIYELL